MNLLAQDMKSKFDELLARIHESWSSFPRLEVFFTGGGASLSMATALVDGPTRIGGVIIEVDRVTQIPDWLVEIEEISDVYPQLAVCIGGAYHGAGFTGLQLDREIEKFGGDLPHAEWNVEVVRKGQ